MTIADLFYQGQAASHEEVTKADAVVENVALQGQCRQSKAVEHLETDEFFFSVPFW